MASCHKCGAEFKDAYVRQQDKLPLCPNCQPSDLPQEEAPGGSATKTTLYTVLISVLGWICVIVSVMIFIGGLSGTNHTGIVPRPRSLSVENLCFDSANILGYSITSILAIACGLILFFQSQKSKGRLLLVSAATAFVLLSLQQAPHLNAGYVALPVLIGAALAIDVVIRFLVRVAHSGAGPALMSCEECGRAVAPTAIRTSHGRHLCPPCAAKAKSEAHRTEPGGTSDQPQPVRKTVERDSARIGEPKSHRSLLPSIWAKVGVLFSRRDTNASVKSAINQDEPSVQGDAPHSSLYSRKKLLAFSALIVLPPALAIGAIKLWPKAPSAFVQFNIEAERCDWRLDADRTSRQTGDLVHRKAQRHPMMMMSTWRTGDLEKVVVSTNVSLDWREAHEKAYDNTKGDVFDKVFAGMQAVQPVESKALNLMLQDLERLCPDQEDSFRQLRVRIDARPSKLDFNGLSATSGIGWRASISTKDSWDGNKFVSAVVEIKLVRL